MDEQIKKVKVVTEYTENHPATPGESGLPEENHITLTEIEGTNKKDEQAEHQSEHSENVGDPDSPPHPEPAHRRQWRKHRKPQ